MHSGLISSETLYKKRGGLLWPNARKRNLIYYSLCSTAFFTIFAHFTQRCCGSLFALSLLIPMWKTLKVGWHTP